MKEYLSFDGVNIPMVLEDIVSKRKEDIKDFNNIKNLFMSGRKVGKVPIGAATDDQDRVGDFNYDQNYLYIVIDNSGTAEWRRIAYTAW